MPREYLGHAGSVLAQVLLFSKLEDDGGSCRASDARVYLRTKDWSKIKSPVYTKLEFC